MLYRVGVLVAVIGTLLLSTNVVTSFSVSLEQTRIVSSRSASSSSLLAAVSELETTGTIEEDAATIENTINAPKAAEVATSTKIRLEKKKKSKSSSKRVDIRFLQKRTRNLLRITSPTDGQATTAIPTTGTKKKEVSRRTFHWLMDAWANSGQPDAPEQALSLLRRMEELSDNKELNWDISPDVRSYTKVMNAYAHQKHSAKGRQNNDKEEAGTRAYELLQQMIEKCEKAMTDGSSGVQPPQPNSQTYTSVLEAYANSQTEQAAKKAQQLCYAMMTNADIVQNKENSETSKKINSVPVPPPTNRSFNAVITAWRKSGHPFSALYAEAFLNSIEGLCIASDAKVLNLEKPNTINYNNVINTYANSGQTDAAQKSEQLLQMMHEHYSSNRNPNVKPNVITYNACIDAWAKSGLDEAGEKAEQLLYQMHALHSKDGQVVDESLKPNTRTYNSVMNAYAKSQKKNAAQEAERILDQMIKGGDDMAKPDLFSFVTVINAWGRSHNRGKANHVLEIFRRMEAMYEIGQNKKIRPNVVVYNAIINACAYTIGDTGEQRQAMKIANMMLQELERNPQYGEPDQITYGTFLKVCESQMPQCDAKNQLVNVVFNKCMRDGQAGKLVLNELKILCAPFPERFEELVGMAIEECRDETSLPWDWRCNVVESRRHRR